MRAPLLLAFLATPLAAQPDVRLTVEADRPVYGYGEVIEVRVSVSNTSDEPVTIWSSSCEAMFVLDGFDALSATPSAEEFPTVYPPRTSRVWVWEVDPAAYGLPETAGLQRTLVGYHTGLLGVRDTTTFEAPAFVGGPITASWDSTRAESEIQPVRDSLNAEVVERYESSDIVIERWRIREVTLADAVARYEDDPRFLDFAVERPPSYAESFVLDAEGSAPQREDALGLVVPNPFAQTASFTVTPPRAERVRVEVLDVLGRRVALLHDGPLVANMAHALTLRASGLVPGVYVVRAAGETFRSSRRVTLSR